MLIFTIVGCASGALFLSLLIILGVLWRELTPTNTSQTVDSTNMSYQRDSKPEPCAVLNQTGDTHTGTIVLPNLAEHQTMHAFEHTLECLTKHRPANENITMATPSNHSSPIADLKNMPDQVNSEPNAVLNQIGDSQTGTMILPKKTEYQNMHLYEYTIENHSKQRLTNRSITVATPSNHPSPIADHTNMPYQVDSEPECNAGTMILTKKTEYQNTHLYEHTIEKHSKQRLPNESITVAPPFYQISPTVDPTYMPY